jgi:hypothetical protein
MKKETITSVKDIRETRAMLALSLAWQEWGGDPENLLWECIGALTRWGTYDKWVEKGEIVREAAIINRDLPINEDNRKRIATSLNELGGYILQMTVGAGKIEEKVKALGCRVNPDGRVTTRQKSKGRDKVRERILKIFSEDYRTEYWTSPDFVDNRQAWFNAACSKSCGLTFPMWLCRRVRL